jgi:hypothetical protein
VPLHSAQLYVSRICRWIKLHQPPLLGRPILTALSFAVFEVRRVIYHLFYIKTILIFPTMYAYSHNTAITVLNCMKRFVSVTQTRCFLLGRNWIFKYDFSNVWSIRTVQEKDLQPTQKPTAKRLSCPVIFIINHTKATCYGNTNYKLTILQQLANTIQAFRCRMLQVYSRIVVLFLTKHINGEEYMFHLIFELKNKMTPQINWHLSIQEQVYSYA